MSGRPRLTHLLLALAATSVALLCLAGTAAASSQLRGAEGYATYDATAKTVTLNTSLLEKAGFEEESGGHEGSYFLFPTIYRVDRTTGDRTEIVRCFGQDTESHDHEHEHGGESTHDDGHGGVTHDTHGEHKGDPEHDHNRAGFTITVNCPQFSPNFDYLFVQAASSRVPGIRNSTNQTVEAEVRVRIDGTHNHGTPTFTASTLTNVPYDPTATFTTTFSSVADDGTPVTFSLVTDQTSNPGGYGAGAIPCSYLNPTTGDFTISTAYCTAAEYAAAFSGGNEDNPVYYALKVKATDALGQSSTEDILLKFATPTTPNHRPSIAACTVSGGSCTAISGQSVTVTPGSTTTIRFTGTDSDSGQLLNFTTAKLPSWATFTPPASATASPATATLVLAPPAGTNAKSELKVAVYDNGSFILSSTKELELKAGSPSVAPGPPSITTLTPASGQLTAAFTAPTRGGTPTGYSMIARPSRGTAVIQSCSMPPATCTTTGLTNGTKYEVTIRATNATGSVESEDKEGTPNGVSKPTISLTTSVVLSQNVAITSSPDVLGKVVSSGNSAPTSYSISPAVATALPGMSFNTTTGVLTGTPTTVSTAAFFTVTATNSAGSASAIAPISVVSQTQTITFTQPYGMPRPSQSGNYHYQRLSATASGGGAVTFSITAGSTYCSIITYSGVSYVRVNYISSSSSIGTCTIAAAQAGGNGYAAAPTVARSFTVFRPRTLSGSNSTTCSLTAGPVGYYTGTSSSRIAPTPILTLTNSAISLTRNVAMGGGDGYQIINAGSGGAPFTSTSSTSTPPTGDQTVPTAGCANLYPASGYSGYGYTITPALPAGLTYSASTGLITGTPTAVSPSTTYTVTLQVPYQNSSSSSSTYTAISGSTTFTLAVTGASQTITWATPPGNQTLGTAPIALTGSLAATASSGLTVSYSSRTTGVCTVSGTTVTIVARGTCTLAAAQTGNASYAPATTVTTSFAVAQRPIIALSTSTGSFSVRTPVSNPYTITNTGDPATSYSITPALPDSMAFDTTTGQIYGTPDAGQSATPYQITASNSAGTSNAVTFTFSVAKVAQEIQFDPPLAMLQNATQTLSASSDSGLPVTLAVTSSSLTSGACAVSGTMLTTPATGTGSCVVTATQAGNGIFAAATSVARTVSVTASVQPPVIATDTPSQTLDVNLPAAPPYLVTNSGGPATTYQLYSTNPSLVPTFSGKGSFAKVTPTVATSSLPTGLSFDPTTGLILDGTPTQLLPATTYYLQATGPGGTSNVVPFTLSVTNVPQTIDFLPLSNMVVGDPDQSLDGAATATSGLAVTYSIAAGSSSVCSIVSGKVHALAGGNCTVVASQAGNVIYAAAPDATQTFEVLRAPAISISPATVTLTALTAVNSSPYTITNTGGTPTSYVISPAAPAGMTFNTTTGALTGTPTTPQSSTTYSITAANTVGASSPASVAITIGKAAQTVTFAQPDAMVKSQAALQIPSASASSGLNVTFARDASSTSSCSVAVNGSTGDWELTAGSTAGTCVIVATQAGDATYTSATATRTFQILNSLAAPAITLSSTSAAITYGADAGTLYAITNTGGPVYGAGNSPTAFAISPSLPAGLTFDTDTGAISGMPTTTSSATTYTITARNATGSGTATFSLTVEKATATVTLANLSATYAPSTPRAATASTSADAIVGTPLTVNLSYQGINGTTYGPSATAPTNAGSYTVTGTISNASYQGTGSDTLVIDKAEAPVTVSAPAATYASGVQRTATATTTPSGLTYTVTYDGSATAPTDAGSYAVLATVNDANYTGTGTATLVISKATATVTLGSLSATYAPSTPRAATSTTSPSGIAVTYVYTGTGGTTYGPSSTAPANAGSYSVTGTIDDPNYSGTSTGTLTIGKATATITFGALAATYAPSTPRSVTTSTTPTGLAVNVTYTGTGGTSYATSATPPTNAGSYTVSGTISDANYQGTGASTLVIAKATAPVVLHSLTQQYTGAPRAATATTTPTGLTVDLTYVGTGGTTYALSSSAPSAVGTYTVDGTINETNYQGTTSGTLTITSVPVAPTVTITSGPNQPTNSTSASIAFTASAGTTTCSIDGNTATSCTSPASYSGLAAGSHTVTVTATDGGLTGTDTYTWTVDTTPPVVTITDKPTNPSSDTSPTFQFSASESVVATCDIGGTPVSCSSPITYGGLGEGSHTFTVHVADAAGNTGSASWTWVIDTTDPTVSIATHPANPTRLMTASFTYTSNETVTYECTLDGVGANCTTQPATYTGVVEGTHTFSVIATDAAGNASTPATFTWVVDISPPTLSLTSTPADPTPATTATFVFSTSGGTSTQCKLESGGTYGACTSATTMTYSGLANGSHTFYVKVSDDAGNVASVSYMWTISPLAPSLAISSGPANPVGSTTANFAFASDPGMTLECKLDGGTYAPCDLATAQAYAALADGSHTFSVRATDPTTLLASTATWTWVVDTTAPTAQITSAPPSTTTSSTATIEFTGSEPATFTCTLDNGATSACTSPKTVRYLAKGHHVMAVTPTDLAGNTGTSASADWTIIDPPAAPSTAAPLPDIAVKVTVPPVLPVGKVFAATVTATNVSVVSATQVRVSASVPSGLHVVGVQNPRIEIRTGSRSLRRSARSAAYASTRGTFQCDVNGQAVVCLTDILAPNEQLVFDIMVDGAKAGQFYDFNAGATAAEHPDVARDAVTIGNQRRCTITGSGRIKGTPGDDVICGSEKADTIYGGGGNDIIYGRGGNDIISAGRGNDHVDGGAGGDRIDGGPGTDQLHGNEGKDVVLGRMGDDHLTGDAGADVLLSGWGTDVLVADAIDTIYLIRSGPVTSWYVKPNSKPVEIVRILSPKDHCRTVSCMRVAGY